MVNILGYIHTLNDRSDLDEVLGEVLGQTYAIREVLIVDSSSTDGTVDRSFPGSVTIIRQKNLGTSGAVRTGLEFALARGYDWMWVLDADTRPPRDSLERLMQLHASIVEAQCCEIGVMGCSHVVLPTPVVLQGRLLTSFGPRNPKINSELRCFDCDCTIWSGSLINLKAVRAVGFPRCGPKGFWDDLGLDYGDFEYTFRIKRGGFKIIVQPANVLKHHVGNSVCWKVCGHPILSTGHPPYRRYLFFRNMVYFWLYLHPSRSLPMVLLYICLRLLATLIKLPFLERDVYNKAKACLIGSWHGLLKVMDRSFPA